MRHKHPNWTTGSMTHFGRRQTDLDFLQRRGRPGRRQPNFAFSIASTKSLAPQRLRLPSQCAGHSIRCSDLPKSHASTQVRGMAIREGWCLDLGSSNHERGVDSYDRHSVLHPKLQAVARCDLENQIVSVSMLQQAPLHKIVISH